VVLVGQEGSNQFGKGEHSWIINRLGQWFSRAATGPDYDL